MTTHSPPAPDRTSSRGGRRPALARALTIGGSVAVLALICMASVAFGVRDVTPAELLRGIAGDTSGIAEAAVHARVPRTVLGLLVGAALGLAGATFQAVTRNPLADPGILGITSGAALAVVIGMSLLGLTGGYPVLFAASVGAALAAVFVYAIGSIGPGGATPLKLALAGAATTAALQAIIGALLLPRVDLLEQFRFWQIGGIGGATWDRITLAAPVLALGAVIVLAMARGMNALALGDDVATSLGAPVARTRLVASIGAVLLCGVATAVAGPIAFVGLVVPHLCRLLLGTDHRWLLPASAVTGAALLLSADIVGRIVLPSSEVEVGIIVALVGAPAFIWIVRRQRVRAL